MQSLCIMVETKRNVLALPERFVFNFMRLFRAASCIVRIFVIKLTKKAAENAARNGSDALNGHSEAVRLKNLFPVSGSGEKILR